MPLKLIHGDITKMKVDAIVNAANKNLAPGGGVCGAIFGAAGYEKLDLACRAIGHCETGKAVITDGFSLASRYIIHTVGPIWQDGNQGEADLLWSCYENSICLALLYNCHSLAFPLISSGIYGYPTKDAICVARDAIKESVKINSMDVSLVLFEKNTYDLAYELIL